MTKLWAGRTDAQLDKTADAFNSSIGFDRRLYREDITGSMAHAAMLAARHIISDGDAQAIEAGQLELNAFLPVVLFQLFEEIDILGNAVVTFTEHCVRGITVNETKCQEDIGKCYSIATALNPIIGYDKSTAIVKKAQRSGQSILAVAREESGLDEEQLDRILNPHALTDLQPADDM